MEDSKVEEENNVTVRGYYYFIFISAVLTDRHFLDRSTSLIL